MLAGLFRSNQPAVLLVLPVVVAGLFLPCFWHEPVAPGMMMPLAAAVASMIGPSAWAGVLLGLLLVMSIAVQLALLMNALEFMDRRNHLVAFLFPVALAGLGGGLGYDPALLGMPFVLMALRRTWSVGNADPALGASFNAGLLIGLAAMCYLPYAFLIAVLWASSSVIRPFAWREYVLPVVGMALPFYFAWVVLNLTDRLPWKPLHTILSPDADPMILSGSSVQVAFMVLMALVILVALFAFSSGYARSIIRGKNLRSSLLAFALALTVIMFMLHLIKDSFPAVLAAVPCAIFGGYAFVAPRRAWLAECAALGLLTLALWVRW
ncbi:MAG: hypothetical protein IPP83_19145 [Flavobacteriales bacterium]|nr:hypothetical protein [Flavobacteriales bacterium]